jgi:Flp pilus assembly protein TadD
MIQDGNPGRVPKPSRDGLALGLAIAVVGVYALLGGVLDGDFAVGWDDDINFTDNRSFRGLGWPQIRWAFTTFHLGVYQPFAWLLLELQYVLFSLEPWGYHLVSLLLHALNTVLVFRLVVALLGWAAKETGKSPGTVVDSRDRWAGAAVALLWGLHPLRVEVVAWASCQPYLLCATFALLSAGAHVRATSAPRPARWRLLSLALFAAALLSKAEAVALPVALLVLDVYPLRRLRLQPGALLRDAAARRALVEKLPFVALAALFALVAMRARFAADHVVSLEHAGPGARAAHAALCVWFYLGKTFVPAALSPYYGLPGDLGRGLAAPGALAAALAAAAVTAAVFARARRFPALAAAWAVYLAFLLPHAGLVRISTQLGADRYTYLSSVALAAALAAALRRLFRRPIRRPALVGALALAVPAALLVIGTARQIAVWRSPERLWALAYRLQPGSSHVANNWGAVLVANERWSEAAEVLRHAARLAPRNAKVFHNLSGALLRLGRVDEAEAAARRAIALGPGVAASHLQLAIVLAEERNPPGAAAAADRAVEVAPGDARIWAQRGQIYLRIGQRRPAEESLARARALDPDLPVARTLERELSSSPPPAAGQSK